jgi:hypothetical protein
MRRKATVAAVTALSAVALAILLSAADPHTNVTQDLVPTKRLMLPMGEIAYFSTTGTAVDITAQSDGSTNMVKAAPVTALSTGGMDFDNGGADNGRLRYTGATTRMFHVACTMSFSAASVNDQLVLGVAKGGTVIAASKAINHTQLTTETQSTALHVMIELAANEYLEIFVGNLTSASDATLKTMNLFAMGM